MHKAYVALGSNLEDPAFQVKKAFLAIGMLPSTGIVKESSLYKSAAVGYEDQPDFINAVVAIETELSPEKLLTELLAIEENFGRERTFANAPRILDLDLLCYENLVRETETLTLPHPRIHMRGFVLLPLAEIAPNLDIPGHGNVVELAQALQNQDVVKLDN